MLQPQVWVDVNKMKISKLSLKKTHLDLYLKIERRSPYLLPLSSLPMNSLCGCGAQRQDMTRLILSVVESVCSLVAVALTQLALKS